MRSIKWFVGAAIGALLLAPGFAKADIQYVYVSGGFSYSGGVLSGTEYVNITDKNGSAITLNPPFSPFAPVSSNGAFKLSITTSSGNVSGSLTDSNNATLFNFSGGMISVFQTNGNSATFIVNGVTYSNVASQLDKPDYLPNGSSGSFTGSTTSWNGTTGAFNGQFNSKAPELGSSVAMATMLVGAGFLGFRKRR